MILDLLCIILALLTRVIKNKTFCAKVEQITINRYLESKKTKKQVTHETLSVFSNDSAIQSVFIEKD